MELAFSKEEQAFADDVRTFITENLPRDISRRVEHDLHLHREDFMRWQQILGRRGWHAYTWPVAQGGPGWSATQRYIFETISAELNCPTIQPFGPRMVGPVIFNFGSDAQKQQHLPGIRASTVWWCQGYSEPASGSDLASLATRAEDRGDHYLVNGQKIWTSYAHYADWMFCLVRTSREAKAQRGISFLLIDMKSPGIVIQPIPMLEGTHSFNAVFLTDVKVPKSNLVGEEGRGWSYAKFLLEHERVENSNIGFSTFAMRRLHRIASGVRHRGRPLLEDPVFRAKVSAVEAQLKALEVTTLRALSSMGSGSSPGAGLASALKIRGTEIGQRITELIFEAAGPQGQVLDPALMRGEGNLDGIEASVRGAAPNYFWRRAMSIYGGSNEIQRNIIAKHELGL
ncbi:Glutaryl-CoA dehydrogenase [Variovorax sp. PBL-H6]|uniref:acyl-CoA dehydrogenase family protein n=1 Tax=Variovorax sp. PBL-H6 TaxID=434009 RepID=UPI001317EF92|nr:acyl-CoA dehydrogenase family protein [Variovorax sp. PBL-H6]VTU21016.1 Glutaryl-CoA dehydrogenase [Variovorax sp. PBL-H6]